jgi:glycosyltransferase involved in cell wall biosynthesis
LVDDFCEEFARVFGAADTPVPLDACEVVFVDDGSTGEASESLAAVVDRFAFARVIRLSRNFGQHQAIACGLDFATGALLGRCNVDQQDPIAELTRFIALLEGDEMELVIGVYQNRQASRGDRVTSFVFERFFRWLSGLDIPPNTSAMRVMTRTYYSAIQAFPERGRYPQGLDAWLALPTAYIDVPHQERARGRSSYSFGRRLALAIDASTTFSDRPLRLLFTIGLLFYLAVFAIFLMAIVLRLRGDNVLSGFLALGLVNLTLSGTILLGLGTVGTYIGNVLKEVQMRPRYVVRSKHGFDTGSEA